jgi:DNA-binding FadR family transcriptional regulator
MTPTIQPLNHLSLKALCVRRLEGLILSGQLRIGERLPAERDLAARLEISRPLLHEALVDLAAKGLVRIVPRRGVFVNDYRTTGSPAMLESLLAFREGSLDPAFTQSLLDMRLLVETETARLAAANRSSEQLKRLAEILYAELNASPDDSAVLTDLDFAFHHEIALASANQVYPLILNSFKGVYTHLSGSFFRTFAGSPVIAEVHAFHRRLLTAFEQRDSAAAVHVMTEMLRHGERYLKGEAK